MVFRQQIDIARWVERDLGIDVRISDRTAIAPLELDVWMPERRLAIEYHGLYWHSGGRNEETPDAVSFERERHSQKHDACDAAGIQLLQFFSDEWTNNERACRSIVRSALGTGTVLDMPVQAFTVRTGDEHIHEFIEANSLRPVEHDRDALVVVADIPIEITDQLGIALLIELVQRKRELVITRAVENPDVCIHGSWDAMLSGLLREARRRGCERLTAVIDRRLQSPRRFVELGFERRGSVKQRSWWTDGRIRSDEKPKDDARLVWDAGGHVYGLKVADRA